MAAWNVYRPLVNPQATDASLTRVVRRAVLVAGISATLIALQVKSIYMLWVLCSDLVYCVLFPQLVLALWDVRANRWGSYAGMAVAFGLRVAAGEPFLGLPRLLPLPLDAAGLDTDADQDDGHARGPGHDVGRLSSNGRALPCRAPRGIGLGPPRTWRHRGDGYGSLPGLPRPIVRHLAFITPRSLSSAHRDEVSRVSLEWTAVVIATSTLISVVRTWISPGPDYRVELTLLLVVIAASLAGSHRLTANGRSAISIGLFAFIGAASLLKSGPAGYLSVLPHHGRHAGGPVPREARLAGGVPDHHEPGWRHRCRGKQWLDSDQLHAPAVPPDANGVCASRLHRRAGQLAAPAGRQRAGHATQREVRTSSASASRSCSALHSTSRLLRNARGFDGALLDRLVALLPPAWQYPAICQARVAYGSIEARSEGWRDSPWKQTASFATGEGQSGTIEVVYLEERPAAAEGPFLAEERSLIESLAEMLREHLEQWRAENVLKAANARYRRQEEALAALMRSSVAGPEQAEAVLREVTEVVAATLDVARVGIWRLNAARTALTCRQLFARDGIALTALPGDHLRSPSVVLSGADRVDRDCGARCAPRSADERVGGRPARSARHHLDSRRTHRRARARSSARCAAIKWGHPGTGPG